MARFLTTKGISYELENIIKRAKDELYIVTPYLKLHDTVIERLKSLSDKGVDIVFIFGKSQLTRKEQRKLDEIKNLSLFYYDNLHAKCYHDGNTAIIGSMNLHEYSELNNREIGMLITRADDPQEIDDLIEEILDIKRNAILVFDKDVEVELRNYDARRDGITKDPLYKHPIVRRFEKEFEGANLSLSGFEIRINKYFNYRSEIVIRLEQNHIVFNLKFNSNYRFDEIIENEIHNNQRRIEEYFNCKMGFEQETRSSFWCQLYFDRKSNIDKINSGGTYDWSFAELSFSEQLIIDVTLFIKQFAEDCEKAIDKPQEKVKFKNNLF